MNFEAAKVLPLISYMYLSPSSSWIGLQRNICIIAYSYWGGVWEMHLTIPCSSGKIWTLWILNYIDSSSFLQNKKRASCKIFSALLFPLSEQIYIVINGIANVGQCTLASPFSQHTQSFKRNSSFCQLYWLCCQCINECSHLLLLLVICSEESVCSLAY